MTSEDRWYGYPAEEKLLGSIISQALDDLLKPDYKRDAWKYFTDKDTDNPCSFLSICKSLGIDPESILVEVYRAYLYNKPYIRR